MKQSVRNALEIEAQGGAVIASHWTSGHHPRHISKRAIPEYCEELDRDQAEELTRGKTRAAVRRLKREHPRARLFICVMNRRALMCETKAEREAEELARQERIRAAKAPPEPLAPIEDPAGTLTEFFADPVHPCPPEILEIKKQSGLTWSQLERATV